jgi:hypothetical protein
VASIVPAKIRALVDFVYYSDVIWHRFSLDTTSLVKQNHCVSLSFGAQLFRGCAMLYSSLPESSCESNNSFLGGNPRSLLLRRYAPSRFHWVYTKHIRNSRACCCGTSFIRYLTRSAQSTLLPCLPPRRHLSPPFTW